jgi:RHS repeat-associated protein
LSFVSPIQNRYRLKGEKKKEGWFEEKKESGLYYYNARYYDLKAEIFITPDPAMDGLNHYAYCSANPINYVDPTGLEGCSAGAAGGVGAAGATGGNAFSNISMQAASAVNCVAYGDVEGLKASYNGEYKFTIGLGVDVGFESNQNKYQGQTEGDNSTSSTTTTQAEEAQGAKVKAKEDG